jgi:two-component system response regulator AtoC
MKEHFVPVPRHSNESSRVLVVSREPAGLAPLWAIGEANDWEMEIAGSGCEALERVQSGGGPHLVLLDLVQGDADGLYILRWLRRVRPDVPVVLLAQADDARQRVEAMRLGAHDYLSQPLDDTQLEAALQRHLASAADNSDTEITSEQIEPVGEDMFFVAASPIMRKLRAQAELLAQVDVPVLIVGENGSGKEATARLIHKLSVRSGFRFRKVNCAALPGDLLERELFGYEPGAFPGAMGARAGKFELSEKGTLLLDDIAETPGNLQAKLLQVLQDKQFSRLGGEARIEVDVRIIAATRGNLEQALAEKKLREDLYYRLSAFTVHVPPLRQRKEEIPLLLGHCMNQMAGRYGLPGKKFSSRVLEACHAHDWPGNLQELENFVKRYLVMGEGDDELAISEMGQSGEPLFVPARLALEPVLHPAREGVESEDSGSGLRSLVQSVKGETERNAIAVALEQTHWNRKAAARLLKVSYRTLLYKIQQYHMTPPPTYLAVSVLGQGSKGNGEGR